MIKEANLVLSCPKFSNRSIKFKLGGGGRGVEEIKGTKARKKERMNE